MKNCFIILSLILLLSCKQEIQTHEISVVPQPVEMENAGAPFTINKKLQLYLMVIIRTLIKLRITSNLS